MISFIRKKIGKKHTGNYPHNGTKMVAPLVIGATSQLLFV